MFDPFSCILLIHGITWIAKVISSSFQMVFVVHLVTLHRVLPICSPSSWNMVCWRQWATFLRLGAPIHGLFQCLLGEFVAHFGKVYTMVKIPRFFFVKKSHALVWGDGGPIPHQLLPAKEVIENEWTRPPQKTFLGVWAVLSSMFFFLFGRMKLCWNVSLRFDKRITESFFPTNKITPHFFLAGKATTNLVLFFQSELPPLMCLGWKCSVSQGEVPFRGNIAPKLPNVFILFFGR